MQMMQNNDPLYQIRREKRRIRKEIRLSRERLHQQVRKVTSPVAHHTEKASSIASYFQQGLYIWQGIRLGMSFIRLFRRARR